MLEANPNLTYRDIEHILVNTTKKGLPHKFSPVLLIDVYLKATATSQDQRAYQQFQR